MFVRWLLGRIVRIKICKRFLRLAGLLLPQKGERKSNEPVTMSEHGTETVLFQQAKSLSHSQVVHKRVYKSNEIFATDAIRSVKRITSNELADRS